MRLWHDDCRPAPEGWVWARTNEQAQEIFETEHVEECSLDHDLGYDGPPPGQCQECEGDGFIHESCGRYEHEYECTCPPFPCGSCDGNGFIGGDVYYIAGTAEETGLDLVRWMVENDRVPEHVTIHSWNPYGARTMAEVLHEAGHDPVVRPYEIPPLGAPTSASEQRMLGFIL